MNAKEVEEIAKDAEKSYQYALNIPKKPFRFRLGEAAIATSAEWSFYYALYVLHAPFPEGEAAIATSAEWSYSYAKMIPKPRPAFFKY